jgi:aminotransferase
MKKAHSDPSHFISDTAAHVPPSGIREFFDIVYSRPDCISLGVGEPDFDTPWRISDCGIYSIKDGYTHYTPNRGLPALRELITRHLKDSYSLHFNPDTDLIITMGVSQGLDLVLRGIINPGDEVIIFEPCYVSYRANIEMLHGVAVSVETLFSENFDINIDRLIRAITPKTKAILLNYPANPTGKSFSREKLEEIARVAIKHDLLVISDEIYSGIIYSGKHTSIVSLPGMKERSIYLNGFSKSHAMTGWRLGYIAGPEELISAMLKIHQYTALCAPSMAQHAAVEALENGERDVQRMITEYLRRRNFIVSRFNEAGLPCHTPEGAFYVFPNITPTGLSSKEFALKLLDAKNVAVVPGSAFGASGEGYIRCSYATSMENIREALIRIEAFVKERSWES